MENKKLVIFDFSGVFVNVVSEVSSVLYGKVQILAKKYILSVISSMSSGTIISFLEEKGIREYFADVMGYEILRSKAGRINYLLKKYNISPTNAVYITDTAGDINEAGKCWVKAIAVTWGFQSKEELEKAGPTKIIDSPLNLVGAIEDVLK
ncbi:hypothetical protein A2733_01835 [Candidatus Nomurabacteria bacterium RIFCSPHIGHO2_01_FULL_40_20]|uniref:HAD family hydrolase n=1 Tax=Candidatus Nomurabacteria bacterium RIFCSPHIGHO2_01_FULL_40_20 TaxID=1801738 RepID=A0A1F6V1B4_9BACT|nr:MAG: hypothetical protein A2733_01835 [Candidatus Nomurabacteria bacterium RIFCSPHIGHO2_01_FULL_40_20]